MRKRLLALLGLALAGGVVVIVLTLGSASAITQPVELHLVEGPGSETHLDLGQPGDSQGDQDIFTVVIKDEFDVQIGTANGHCTLTDPAEDIFVCVEIFSLPKGSITIEGANPIVEEGAAVAVPEDRRRSAVTGGTGAYSNVRGFAIEQGGGHEEEIVIHLTP